MGTLFDGACCDIVKIQINRHSGAHYDPVTGLYVTSSATPEEIDAIVLRDNSSDLQYLDEELRYEEFISVYTETEIIVRNGDQEADTFTYDGETWRVQRLWNRSEEAGFWKAICIRNRHSV